MVKQRRDRRATPAPPSHQCCTGRPVEGQTLIHSGLPPNEIIIQPLNNFSLPLKFSGFLVNTATGLPAPTWTGKKGRREEKKGREEKGREEKEKRKERKEGKRKERKLSIKYMQGEQVKSLVNNC